MSIHNPDCYLGWDTFIVFYYLAKTCALLKSECTMLKMNLEVEDNFGPAVKLSTEL